MRTGCARQRRRWRRRQRRGRWRGRRGAPGSEAAASLGPSASQSVPSWRGGSSSPPPARSSPGARDRAAGPPPGAHESQSEEGRVERPRSGGAIAADGPVPRGPSPGRDSPERRGSRAIRSQCGLQAEQPAECHERQFYSHPPLSSALARVMHVAPLNRAVPQHGVQPGAQGIHPASQSQQQQQHPQQQQQQQQQQQHSVGPRDVASSSLRMRNNCWPKEQDGGGQAQQQQPSQQPAQQQAQPYQEQAPGSALGNDQDGCGGGRGMEGQDPEKDDPVHLKRRVGLVSGVALIVGTMIGSGIFVSPSGLLVRTGSVGMSFIVWTGCGLLSLCGALAYAELGTMNTSSGAEYAYFMDAFGAPPAFLFSWVSTLVLKPSQMAIICLSFAQYAVEAFAAECDPPPEVVKLVALLAIVVILLVNCYSVNLATGVQNAFTAGKLIAILVIVAGGTYKLAQGNTQHLQKAFSEIEESNEDATEPLFSVGKLATAFYTGLWAYDGWNNLNYVTEEIKDPSRNLPRSIMIGIPLVTLCYALINVSYLAVMSPLEMIDSEAVAVTFGNRILGVMAWLMPLSVAVSTFGSANGTLFAAGRLCFAASREGHLMDCLSYVHVRRFTPAPGLIFHSLVAGAMVLSGSIDSLIDFFSFTAWIFYGGAMLALLVMRRTRPNHPRPYRCPIVIPVLVLLISVYLIVAPIIDNPKIEYLYAAAFIAAGMLFYLPFVKYRYVPKFMEGVNAFLQVLLEVAPTAAAFD